MQNDGHDAFNTRCAPGSDREGTSNKLQLNEKTARRLEKLERLRMDPALIKFPEGAPEFKGGYAIVSRALLGSRSDSTRGRVVASNSGNLKSSDRITNLPNLEGGNRRREAEGSNNDADHVYREGDKGNESESDGETSGSGKAIAVKKMKVKTPDEVLRVLSLTLREAEVLASLSHENIIKLEGFVEDVSKEVIWLVFPWEDHGNLKDFGAVRNWEIPERIQLIYDVTRGVEYLHTRTPPICHADLKSINILVNSKCQAVITDFGSAHHPESTGHNTEREGPNKQPEPVPPVEATFCSSTNTITLTGIQYTIRWAAPEVLESDEFSLASDIWALGWVAYEVMTNYIPFHDVKEPMVINRVVRGDLPSISKDVRMLLMQALCTLVGQCWNIDSSKRPTAKNCRESISWMPMIAPNLGRTKDATFVDHSAELLMKLGEMHRRQSDYLNGLKYFSKALDVYTDKADRRGEANALVQIAQIHGMQQRYNEAITYYTQALEIQTGLGNKQGRADALFGLAQVHRLRHESNQAVTFYSECLQIRTDMGDIAGRADVLWGLASVHRLRKEYNQAATFYSQCLQIRTDIGDSQGRASALWGLAEVHRARKEYSEAVTFYSECLQIRTDIGNRRGRADALWGLAEVHRVRNEYTQAFTSYSECLQIQTDVGDRRGRAQALWGLGEVHRVRNESSQAIMFFNEALTMFTGIGDKYWSAFTLRSMAYAHHDQGHHSNAIRHYEQAAELFKQNGNSNEESMARKQAADLRQSLEQ